MWECPRCETLNEGAFCVVCDEAEPMEEEVRGYVPDDFVDGGAIYPGDVNTEKKGNLGKVMLVLVLIIAVLIIGIMAASEIAQASDIDEEYTINDKYEYCEWDCNKMQVKEIA